MNQKLESPSDSLLFLSLFISTQVQMMQREQTTKWNSNRWPEEEKSSSVIFFSVFSRYMNFLIPFDRVKIAIKYNLQTIHVTLTQSGFYMSSCLICVRAFPKYNSLSTCRSWGSFIQNWSWTDPQHSWYSHGLGRSQTLAQSFPNKWT